MDLHLTDQVVVISGGGTGIGKAAALAFLEEGARVAVFGRRREVLEAFADECEKRGQTILYDALDVADKAAVTAFADRVYRQYGRVDVWVNNAGIALNRPFLDFTEEEFDRIMDTNLRGTFYGAQVAATYMKKGNGGVIINASSFASLIPHANGVPYAASKAAVSNMTRSLAAALAPFGIRVVGYIPGMILSDMSEEFIAEYEKKFTADIALGRLGTPEDLAKPIVFLASDAARYISGCDLQISGGKFAAQDCSMAYRMEEEARADTGT